MQIVSEPGDEIPGTAAWRGAGASSCYQPIHPPKGEQEQGAARRQKKGAPRANFHPTPARLMSCEVEFTHAVSPLPRTGRGLDPACTHTAPALAEHASILQHAGIQRGVSSPHRTPLARKQMERKGLGFRPVLICWL